MKATHPITKKTYFFVDKCMSFGASISCKIFQDISDAIAYLVRKRIKNPTLNYFDDYFFAAMLAAICNWQMQTFLDICHDIHLPVSPEKTFWSATRLTFLGLLIDTENQVVCIPIKKVTRALDMIAFFTNKANKKATEHQVQKLCGFLNFLCRCVIPGKTFLRRTYSLVSSKMKKFHHVRISRETRMDLMVWQRFLEHPDVFCRPFFEFEPLGADDIYMYSDASRNFSKGFGAICNDEWIHGVWDKAFMEKYQPSIQYLELFGVTVAVLKWIKLFKNKTISLFCDNQSAPDMINGQMSGCKQCMVLLRFIVLEGLKHNVWIKAKYVESKKNILADALSRLEFDRFREKGEHMKILPEQIPQEIWPLSKIWLYD